MRSWDYPFDPVVIECRRCKRLGRYSKARFLELVGRDTSLPNALAIIASDCPREKTGLTLHNRCEAGYPDLAKSFDQRERKGR